MGKKWWLLGIALAAALLLPQTAQNSAALPVFSQPELTVPGLTTLPRTEVEFPCVLRGTGLILQNLVRYDGLFPEGLSEHQVLDGAALMVYNPGNAWIRSVKILLTQGGKEYLYEISDLPPNSRILVVERNGQRYSEASVESCRCLSLSISEDPMLPKGIGIKDTASGFAVENLTGQKIHRMTVYYKQYISDGDFYLGGYTYQKELAEMDIGESRKVEGYRYVPGYSRVVAVKWEE